MQGELKRVKKGKKKEGKGEMKNMNRRKLATALAGVAQWGQPANKWSRVQFPV